MTRNSNEVGAGVPCTPEGTSGPQTEMPWLIAREGNITAHFSPDSSLDASHALNIVTAETAMRLAKAINDVYYHCVKNDGGCPRCFLVALSLRLEGEGWEIMQDLHEGGPCHVK